MRLDLLHANNHQGLSMDNRRPHASARLRRSTLARLMGAFGVPAFLAALTIGIAGIAPLKGQTATAGATGQPRIVGFALDGQVREAKSECVGDFCSSYVLLRPESDDAATVGRDDPILELWRLDVPDSGAAEPTLRRLRSDIPNSARRLALCQRDQTQSMVMLQALGSVFFVDPDSEDQALGSGTRVGSQKWAAPARPWRPDCSELMLVGPGAIRQVTLAGRGTRRSVLQAKEFPIDFSIRRNGSGLTLESPSVRSVDERSSLVAVGPQTYDDLRIESLVFRPSEGSAQWLKELKSGAGDDADAAAADPSAGMLRSWSRLPAAEEVLQSRYTRVNGELVLVTVTKEADKVGLLERKKLRLFELEADRSRSGKLPFFEVLSASRLWQRLDIRFLDVNGDQLEDLVLIQPEGLSGEPTLADVFVATSARRFSKKKVRTVLKTGAAWWSLENDWNGDGRLDVAVLDGDVLQLHHGADPQAQGSKRRKGGYWSAEPSKILRLSDARLFATGPERLRIANRDVKDANRGLKEIGPSVLQRVWVDDQLMVIPTGFERVVEVADDDDAVIGIEYDDSATRESSANEDDEAESKDLLGVIYVVRR